MAARPETRPLPKKAGLEESAPEEVGQKKRAEKGPFRLQVDRQTKDSFATYEEAAAAGLMVKRCHPVVQVSIYNTVKRENKILELPIAKQP
jgi:hypothetical protein